MSERLLSVVPVKPMNTPNKEFRPQLENKCYQKTFVDDSHSTLPPNLWFHDPWTPRWNAIYLCPPFRVCINQIQSFFYSRNNLGDPSIKGFVLCKFSLSPLMSRLREGKVRIYNLKALQCWDFHRKTKLWDLVYMHPGRMRVGMPLILFLKVDFAKHTTLHPSLPSQ